MFFQVLFAEGSEEKPRRDIHVKIIKEEFTPYKRYTDILNDFQEKNKRRESEKEMVEPPRKDKRTEPKHEAQKVEKYEKYPEIPSKEPLYPRDHIVFPEKIVMGRNIMDPIPVQNNLQLYPFHIPLSFEGSRLLKAKQMEIHVHQTYVKGDLQDSSAVHQLRMKQWFSMQTFEFNVGLHPNATFKVNIPLYHFSGTTSFTQNGVEMIGLGTNTRNFWGGPTIGLKTVFIDNPAIQFKNRLSFYFQFPESNQRSQGGTDSGHWAMNMISEKYVGSYRLTSNIGFVEAGNLNLLNSTTLKQRRGYFGALALSRNIKPTLALEGQLHVHRSPLSHTGLDAFRKLQMYASFGARSTFKHLDFSSAILVGDNKNPTYGVTLDIAYRF